jgi:hypothetical protein
MMLLGCAALAVVVLGCDQATEYANSCPRINFVGDAQVVGQDLHLGIWLQDLEEDPVDLLVTDGAGNGLESVFGHGTNGLTTLADYPGKPHLLVLPSQVAPPGTTLEFVPEDGGGCLGPAVTFVVPSL